MTIFYDQHSLVPLFVVDDFVLHEWFCFVCDCESITLKSWIDALGIQHVLKFDFGSNNVL